MDAGSAPEASKVVNIGEAEAADARNNANAAANADPRFIVPSFEKT
jgi:hypothetical protein